VRDKLGRYAERVAAISPDGARTFPDLELPSPPADAGNSAASRRVPGGVATGGAPVSGGAGARHGSDGDAGAEAADGAPPAAAPASRAGALLGRRGALLAEAVLRLQRVERAQVAGEVELHAPESGAARSGALTGVMGVEQLSSVCLRRGGSGEVA